MTKLRVGERLERLEAGQVTTNAHLARIDETLHAVSRVFELMDRRLEHLERSQEVIVEGQTRIVERLDRLVDASVRDRTMHVERLARVEVRLDAVERKLEERPGP
jgi:hypothetical protein